MYVNLDRNISNDSTVYGKAILGKAILLCTGKQFYCVQLHDATVYS